MKHHPTIILLLCAACRLHAAEPAVDTDPIDLHLANGERVLGPLIGETADAYTVHQTVLTKKGEMATDRTIAKTDVASAIHVRPEYDKRARLAGDDAATQGRLAAWCLDEHLVDEADRHAHHALAKDPRNSDGVAVLTALGYVDDHGTWVKTDVYLSTHGLTAYDGVVMTLAQRDALTPLATRRTADHDAQQARQAVAASLATAIARGKARLAADATAKAAVDLRIPQDQAAISAAGAAKQATDAADARVQAEESRLVRQAAGPPISARASDASLAAQRKAKQDADSAAKTALRAQADLTAATQKQAALTAEIAATSADLAANQAKLPAALGEVDAAKARVVDSDQRFAQALAAITPPADLPAQLIKPAH